MRRNSKNCVLKPLGFGIRRACLCCPLAIAFVTACGSDGGVTPPQNALKFQGTVANANSHLPIANALVVTGSYQGAIYTPRAMVSTDAQGRYTIDDQCLTNNYFEAKAPGYQTATTAVACSPERRTLNVALIPTP